jgi:nucleoside 2-deoxyribosyltransferase
MRVLYVCGSFRFRRKIGELERRLKEENIEFRMSKKMTSRGIMGCLEKIDEADVVYVVNPDGYVGKSVCIDIGYAYAKGKPIYVMYQIDDPPIMNMIKGVLSSEELINFLKGGNLSEK